MSRATYRTALAAALFIACASTPLVAQDLSSPAPDDARVYFIEPVDGATVGETFVVKFGLFGMGVAPAGIAIEHTGHHHLLINGPEIDTSLPLPSSDQVIHFGKGQTETVVTLPPGEHSLQLVLGNHLHVPHTPPVTSEVIQVQVRSDSK